MQYNNTTGWTKTQNELTNASIELDTRTNDFNIEGIELREQTAAGGLFKIHKCSHTVFSTYLTIL